MADPPAGQPEQTGLSGDSLGLLDALLGRAPFGVALFNLDLTYLWVNEALAAQNGRSAAEHAGRSFVELFPDLEHTFAATLAQVRDTGVGLELDIEGPVPGAGGAEGAATTALYPILDGAGSPQGVGVVVVDTTARVAAERELAATAALLDTVLRTAPVGFALLDEQRRIVRVNDALAAIDGVPAADHLGRDVGELFPALVDRIGPMADRALRGGTPVVDLEVTGENRRGEHVEVLLSCYPVVDDGNLEQIGVVVVDVTERNRMRSAVERGLRQRMAQQQAALDILQHGLLPRSLPELAGADLDARYLAADDEVEVGGDWYDALEVRELGVTYLAVGDVAGHGLGSVETMGQLRNAARGWFVDGEPPASVLARLNRLLLATEPGQVATLVVATYDDVSGTVSLSLAGHPPPMVARRDGTVEPVTAPPGPPLGALDAPVFAPVELRLQEGDTLLLYTDGLIERRDEGLDEGLARLAHALAANVDRPVDDLLSQVLGAALPPSDRFDDLCALALRRRATDRPPG